MSTQGTSKCDDCGEEIPAKAKFCPECGVARKRPYIKPEEAVIIDIGPTARSEDGTINLRKRRTVDEAGALEPTVKVRKKGNGASEKAVQSDDITGSKLAAVGESSSLPEQSANTAQPEALCDNGTATGRATPAGTTSKGATHAGTTPGGATPAGTTPGGATPAGTTPGGATHAGTTPGGTTPAGTTPEGAIPAGTTPEGATHAGTTPGGATHAGTTPGGITPAGTTPEGAIPAGTTPGGATHAGTTPGGATHAGTTPGGATHAGTTPGGATHAGTTPENATPAGTTPEGATPAGTTPGGATPTGTTPEGATHAGTTPGGATHSGTTPEGATPAGTTPGGTTPAGTTPGGATPAGTTPAGATPAGTTPAGATPAGTIPIGTAPAATSACTTPAGTTPDGTTPAGATLSGNTPAGITPDGITPSGTTPSCTTPSGTTPSGTTHDGTTIVDTTPATGTDAVLDVAAMQSDGIKNEGRDDDKDLHMKQGDHNTSEGQGGEQKYPRVENDNENEQTGAHLTFNRSSSKTAGESTTGEEVHLVRHVTSDGQGSSQQIWGRTGSDVVPRYGDDHSGAHFADFTSHNNQGDRMGSGQTVMDGDNGNRPGFPAGASGNGVPYKKPRDAPEFDPVQVKQNSAGSRKTAGKVEISGFECTPEDSIAVTFHVLLPYLVWDCNEQTKLVMYFGHQKLGDWRAYVGNFTSRDIGGGLWEMSATISIQATLLNNANSIPYKYGVLNYKSDNIKSDFEFLHGAPGSGEPVNRCLIIPTSLFQSGGKYNQFDTMVYPEFKSRTYFGKFTDWLSRSSSTYIPDSESMRQKCLMTYLDRVREDLIHCFATYTYTYAVDEVVNYAIQIVTSLATQRIAHPHTGKVAVWGENRLLSHFMLKDWMFPIVDIVKDHPVNTAEESGKKVMAGIIIICIIGKLLEINLLTLNDIPPFYAASMLQTLYLHPDLENKKCLDYEFVRRIIPDYYVKDCTSAIAKLGDYLMAKTDIERAEWLYCLPILHFLNNDVKPFHTLDLPPVEKIVFTDRHLKLGTISKKVADREGFFEKYFEKLKLLLCADPLLQCALTYICPRKDRSLLIRNVSPYLCIAFMIKKLQEKDKSELVYWSTGLALQHIEDVTVTLKTSPTNFNPSYMLDAAIQLLFICTKATCSRTPHYLKVYKAILLLIFSATLHLRPSESDSNVLKIVNDNIAKIQQCFSDWISDMSIIGRDIFGGDRNAIHQWSAVEELKIWVSLFGAECPAEFTQQWHGVVKNIVESRVFKLNPENRINLLCMLESCEGTPDLLVNIFTEAAITALDSINEQGWKSTVQNLEKFCSETSTKSAQRIGRVLTSLIRKKYPKGKDSISFEELLDWGLWSSYIRIYSECLVIQNQAALPEECILICTFAQSKLEEMWGQMLEAKIVVSDLENVAQHQQNMENLCCAVGIGIKEPRRKQQWSLETVRTIMQQRITELTAVYSYSQKLKYLCSRLPNTAEFVELRKELHGDIRSKSIGTLCTSSKGNIIYNCFKSASPLQDMLCNFYLLAQNDLFSQLWQEKVLVADISITVVSQQIWPKAYSHAQELMEALHGRTMKLADVDHYLSKYGARAELTTVLMNLNDHLNTCTGRSHDDKWIGNVVHTIMQYWSLKEHKKTAETFLRLKEELKLTGSFKQVEALASEVSVSMRDQTLQVVDENLVGVGQFLKSFVTGQHREKLLCLEMFIKCQDVVQWLRKETKDVVDLQSFVNVSLTTSAGEGDLANDKLSTLSIVGTGYRSLIYELKLDAGFEALSRGCSTIWKALEENPNLPKLLEDCNSELEWYKSVKATQGRVEVTSFELMKNILQYGYYTVEARLGCGSIHDAVRVDLDDKKLSKKSFTLDELRDLESKLVLITGSKAEYRKEVDHFLDTLHSICHIADILLNLQQAGNVKYLNWKMIARCSDNKSLIGELQKEARRMEDDLNIWIEEVKKSRMEYYELNNYTTAQLVILRRELGKMKINSGAATADPRVMLLLHSISTDLTPDAVKDSVSNFLLEIASAEAMSIEQHDNVCKQASPVSISENLHAHHQSAPLVGSVNLNQFATNVVLDSVSVEIKQSGTISHGKLSAMLSVEELSGKLKDTYVNLTSTFGYSSKLVLGALEHCGEDRYAAEQWCMDHMEDSYAEVETHLDDEVSHSESEEEPMDHNEQELEHQNRSSDELRVSEDTQPTKITVTTMKPIDASHAVVIELMESGFSEAECIRAAQRFRGDRVAALDFLISKTDGELFCSDAMEYTDELSCPLIETTSTSDIVIYADTGDNHTVQFLTLSELGLLLKDLSAGTQVQQQRSFSKQLKLGSPNLLITNPDNVLKTVLSLYMEDQTMPLPFLEEVLICTQQTTEEEVTLLWRRAVGDPGFKRLFCLVHAEKLSYQVCDRALWTLDEITQGRIDYRLVIICTNEGEEKSHFVSTLHAHQQQYTPMHSVPDYCKYLKSKFTTTSPAQKLFRGVLACGVDYENSCVRVVKSTRSGMGKSLYIKKMAKKLEQLKSSSQHLVTIPIHGPIVTSDIVLRFLQNHTSEPFNSTIIHFDISPKVLRQVDTLLFSLLVLRGLCDSHGSVWRCHPSQLCAVEITVPTYQANNGPERCALSLLELLPAVDCVTPYEAHQLMKSGPKFPEKCLMDEEEFRAPTFQRVYQYLRRHIAKHDLDVFSFTGLVEGNPADCLYLLLASCGVQSPSWLEIRNFVMFLDIQLHSCQNSVFCDAALVGDVMKGLKGFVVKFMIQMSKDFASPSLQGEENVTGRGISEEDILKDYQISKRKQWEQSPHPYIFFNEDRISVTFVGFKVNRTTGDLINPADNSVIEKAILSPQLVVGLEHNQVNFNEDYTTWSQNKELMLHKLGRVMGLEKPKDPDVSYVLTVDNLIKILAIQMRFRCDIPVVIMGETGCGKTRLIRYMCDLIAQGPARNTMFILKVHGGTTEDDIIKAVNRAQAQAYENRLYHLDTVLFFDEANTTDAIGLIKEIMCDHRMNGKPISKDVKFIAACNPYRKHTEKMIKKLESAGLGFYVKSTETQDRLGKIPLRQLVYRVLDLPPSMRPLVYDFGQLNRVNETEYVQQIVKNHFKHIQDLSQHVAAVATVLAWSQAYMRNREDECSFVSLRDVERCMIVFEYFFERKDLFSPEMVKKAANEKKVPLADHVTRSLVLALSICYHARLQDRADYEKGVSQQFVRPLALPGGAEQFKDEIKWCQEVLLDGMLLGPNIARNSALRENVFMMAICIELRIPLFLVGKPGSSKSLAKSIVSSSMQGKASKHDLLRHFKQVHMFSYQCSQLSTPESVIEVFKTAAHFQQNRNVAEFVSIVVLDEVGLAEDSPNLPLKALHPLLEDGTEGADDTQQIIAREKRVAFIGISNWALDPAKMNRGVMLTRGEPSSDELTLSARGICSNQDNDDVRERLEGLFVPLSEAYYAICKKQEKDFFGLRDFYSLIKMLYWICAKSNAHPLNWQSLEHAIRRNFGGLEQFDPVQEFRDRISLPADAESGSIPEELRDIVSPGCSQLDLIKASLKTRETTWHGENRYLLFLTENYAALRILHHYLQDVVAISPAKSRDQMDEDTFNLAHMEPFVLFGSSFPKDKEYTQVCRNINQIKICMETGRTVILLNLESLYESLYDVLNQYYIYHGGNRYVDLGLQTHRVKCRVHDNFKLILIAEKTTVYDKFPTPLINRLEKHFVLTKSILTSWQHDVLEKFEDWIDQFCNIEDLNRNQRFRREDAFVGYQNDTPAAVVFHATHSMSVLQKQLKDGSVKHHFILELAHITAEIYVTKEEGSEAWCEAILMQSKWLLLQTASPAALIRLKNSSSLQSEVQLLNDIYFIQQHHSSLLEFLFYNLNESTITEGLLMQITTSSHLLTSNEVNEIADGLKMPRSQVSCYLLQEFNTELDFCNKISLSFKREHDAAYNTLLIIQCEAGHLCGDLIACARYRVYDERAKAVRINSFEQGTTHVVFIIQLPPHTSGSSFVGFQGEPWVSAHVDELHSTESDLLTLNDAMNYKISELFVGASHRGSTMLMDVSSESFERSHSEEMECSAQPVHITPQHKRLYSCIQAAVAKLRDVSNNKERAIKRIAILHDLIPKCQQTSCDEHSFYGALVGRISRVLKKRDEIVGFDKDWVLNEALDCRRLQQGGTFRNSLTRRLDEVIIPIFSAVIAFCDQYCNLNLVRGINENDLVSRFWLSMFRNSDVVLFNYEDMATNPKPDIGGGKASEDFECKMPFFWIIKEAIDSIWNSVSNNTGKSVTEILKQICSLVSQTPLGEVLGSVPDSEQLQLYNCYLHDYVKSVHKCYHKHEEVSMQENNLVTDALNQLTCDTRFCSIDGDRSVMHRICTLHVVYEIHKSELLWFGQLTQQIPSIVLSMHPINSPETMVLHLRAVENAFQYLEPPILKDESTLQKWMRDVQKSQNAVDSILLLPTTPVSFSRQPWYLILVMKLFVEDVMLKHEGTVVYARRLHMFLKAHVDFHEADSVVKTKKVLNSMDSELKTKKGKSQLKALRSDCHVFFMEVVSTLCFGYGTPEDKLIKMLIDTVFLERGDAGVTTKELTYAESKADSVPVIRSFLLKLLVDQKDRNEQVKEHLQNYFEKSKRAVSGVDQDLCLLCAQCFEDSTYKELSVRPLKSIADEEVADILEKAYTVLCAQYTCRFAELSVSYLEKVAHMRYGLSVVAEILSRQVTVDEEPIIAPRLMQIANKICTDRTINTFDQSACTGPSVFLVKLIVRQYGVACLDKIVVDHPWVVPEVLQSQGQDKRRDPFVVYGSDYVKVRDAVAGAIYGNLVKELSEVVKPQVGYTVSYLPLSVFEVATLSKASLQPSKQLLPNAVTEFDKFIKDQSQLGSELTRIARALLVNQQGGQLVQLQVSPQQPSLARDLTALVVHTAIVLSARKDTDVLIPFVNMFNNPAALVNAYLPTMPEDNLPDVRKAISGAFYQCPRGHPYLVTECGQPMMHYTCHCGAQIGGHNHVLVSTNIAARSTDETPTGHALGSPDGRSNTLPERGLSPTVCCILRALMHSALLWASCNTQNASAGLVQLIKPTLREQEIPEFLWKHLEKDLTLLGRALGRSVDEAVLVIHLVLQDILVKDIPKTDVAQGLGALAQRAARDSWETLINQTYMQPFLKEWDQRVGAAMQAMLNDQSKEQDRLFFTVYERARLNEESTEPHFWIYRLRISLEHLNQILLANNHHKKYSLLHAFLQEEPNLRATQYLPDIVQLQQYLYKKCNCHLDRKDGKMTIGQFMKREKVEGTLAQLRRMVISLSKAWELVHERLPEHARLRVDHKYLVPSISLDTKLEYLIPTTTGAGVCTTSLVDFLVCTHNDFMEKCREKGDKWVVQKIPLTQINSCHIVDYEHQLLPIILSHCHYSLTYGKGQQIEYDFPALEKHILDRFIYGKPHIMLEIPHVVFKEDRYTEATFAAIRKKVHQENLSHELQEQIIKELSLVHKLKEAMDAVEIILVFVSSGGAKAEKNLGEYAERALRMDRQFCSVAQKYCKLKHIISLWQTISVKLARPLALKGQEPFEQLDKEFSNTLSEVQVSALNRILHSYDIELLLGILFEFIETHLRHSSSELEWPLVDTLQAFVDTHGISLGAKYFDQLNEIKLLNSQAVAFWKYIIVYQDKQRKGR